jgi:RimJ/RimL family protein N-acetyltransferase
VIRRLFLEEGGKWSLAKLLPQDARWLETWVNDPATTRYMATGRTQTTVDALAAQIAAWKEPLDWPFAVVVEGYEDPIGTVGLYGVDWISRKAEFRILIGEPYCGKGWGTIATRLAVRFGFERLNLHRIWLGVTGSNTRAIRAYENAGFIYEGTLADDLYRDGRYYDSIRMAIRREQWEWDTAKVKPAETSAPGPDTARRVAPPWIGSLPPGVA